MTTTGMQPGALTLYGRLLVLSNSYEPEKITISPKEAKELVAAIDAVAAIRRALEALKP